jgi:ETC complex I subunit conserved region
VLCYTAKPQTFAGLHGDGSELHVPENITEIAVLSGIPREHANRTVIIAPRMHKTLSSGDKYRHQWQITWQNNERWSNPLMGWTSNADPMSQVKVWMVMAMPVHNSYHIRKPEDFLQSILKFYARDIHRTTQLTFDSMEDAQAFANRNGWKYETRSPIPEGLTEPGTFLYEHNFLAKQVCQILCIYKCVCVVFLIPAMPWESTFYVDRTIFDVDIRFAL